MLRLSSTTLCLFAIFAFGLASCGGGKEKKAASTESDRELRTEMPELPEGFVVRPVFRTLDLDFSAGVAFFAKEPESGKRLLLTSSQLLGPGGGYFKKIDPSQGITVLGRRDAFTGEAGFDVQVQGLALPSAPFGQDSGAGDVEAFVIQDKGNTGAVVLPEPGGIAMKPGEEVWIVGPLDPKSGGRLFRGKVTDFSDGFLHYELQLKNLEASTCAGAPVLDADGRLVGIHVAGAISDEGVVNGAATPVQRFAKHLGEAVRGLDPGLTAKNAKRPNDSKNPTSN